MATFRSVPSSEPVRLGAAGPRRSLWQRLGPGGRLALWLLVTLRIGLGLVGAFSINLQPPTYEMGTWLNLVIRGHKPWSDIVSVWQRWDALWYQQIADHGYHANDDTTAFYPLYPLLSRVVSVPLAGHIVVAELLITSVAFFVAMWLLYRLARLDVGPLAATIAVLATCLFPTGFFFLAPYTESLFLAFSVAAFWFARRGRPWLAGLAGFGAGLTRAQGALLVLPLAFEYLRQRDAEGKRPGLGLAASTLAPLALILVTLYQHMIVGDVRSTLAIQADWGYQVVTPWRALGDSWRYIMASGDTVELLNIVCLIGFGLLALIVARRLPLLYALYVFPYLAVLFTREQYPPLLSVSRYTLVLFPCFIVLSGWLARRPWLAAGCLAVSALLQTMLFDYWVHWGLVV